jgi:AraC family transcriptional regulator, transcriptional activator of pobA
VQARPLPGGERIEVSRFDRRHERLQVGPHRHRDLELMYFERGGGAQRVAGRTYEIASGDVLLVTPGSVHDVPAVGSTRGWVVEFDPLAVGLDTIAEPVQGPSLSLPRMWWANPRLAPFLHAEQHRASARFNVQPEQRSLWTAHLRIMHRELTERRDGYREMVAAYLQIVLVALSRLAIQDTEGLGHSGEPVVAHVFEVIEQRYAEPLGTSDVAAAVGLTPGHLTTIVRRRTGRSVGDWIAERRMAAARELLTSTDLSAEQIAARVGYPDPAYFSRRFRRVHGVPPGAWRAAARR